MPISITKPNEIAFIKGLIFGPNGRGKTTFCGSAQLDPRTSPSLIIDFRGNVEVLSGLNIDVVKVGSIREFRGIHAFLTKENASQKNPYRSVSIDSLSEVSTQALFNEMDRRVALAGEKPEISKGRVDLPDQAQLQDYGAILIQQLRLLKLFYDIPIHTFYTAFDFVEAEPGEGMVKKPAMEGQMRNRAGGLMTVVGYLALDTEKKDEKGEPLRVLQLRDIPLVRVKARTSWGGKEAIPRILENPTVTRLMDVCFPTVEKMKGAA